MSAVVNAVQEQWKSARDSASRVELLAREGRRACVRTNRDLAAIYKAQRLPFWPFSVAHSLVSSTHARGESGFYPAVAQFLRTGARTDLIPARGFSSSFGPDALERALGSFRNFGEYCGASALKKFDALSLARAQAKAVELTMKKEVPGLGAWLFCAPFELLALLQPSSWENPALDSLLLPMGSQLARGFGLLKKAGLVDVDEQLLRDTEPGLRNGLTLLFIARGCEEKLAQQAKVRILFIHHGITELGRAR